MSATRSTRWGAGSRARDLPSTFRERFDGGPTVTTAEISQRVQAKPVSRLEKHGTQRAAGRAGLTGRAEGVGGPSTQRWARRPWEPPGHWAYATPLFLSSHFQVTGSVHGSWSHTARSSLSFSPRLCATNTTRP